ncbi:MAG: hypothetical protein LC674_05635 [Actinobacteria bacterium]|nr:hypothetical protein [Actinomycetota bacterium]
MSHARAQGLAAQPQSDIVIVGQRLKDALRHFVNSVTQTGPTDQIARWNQRICPRVIGIDPAQAEFLRRRIAEIAKTVGLGTGRSTCPTMLTIVFTPDAAALAGVVASDFPSDNWKVRALLREFTNRTKPVRWISLVDECGGADPIPGGGCPLPNTRIVKATSPTLQAMLIIVDATKIAGLSIGEMSDYLAVVALSNPPLTTEPPPNSILSLFSASATTGPDLQLTDYDYSFLSGLYGMRLNLDVATQRASIASRMVIELRRKSSKDQSPAPPQK